MPGTQFEVLFQGRKQVFDGFQTILQRFVGCRDDASILIDTGCLQVIRDNPDVLIVYANIGYQGQIHGMQVIGRFNDTNRIAAIDSQRQVVGPEAIDLVG